MSKSLKVVFGALSRPIAEQVPSLSKKDARFFQTRADYITCLLIGQVLSESEARQARKRLLKKIAQAANA